MADMPSVEFFIHDTYFIVSPLGVALILAVGLMIVLGLIVWTVRRNRH